MQLNTVSIAPVIRSSSSSSSTRAPTALAQDYPSQSYTKKPKRKKKHRKKNREQPDLAAKLRAEAEANGERPSKRARTNGGKDEYDGTTTSGRAAANILAGNNQGRAYTVSVALPGSIVANAQSRELRTYLVGQIARSLAIFNIDEVVVYDDRSVASEEDSGKRRPYGDPCHFMARVLQYLETPQVSGWSLVVVAIDIAIFFSSLSSLLSLPSISFFLTMTKQKYKLHELLDEHQFVAIHFQSHITCLRCYRCLSPFFV